MPEDSPPPPLAPGPTPTGYQRTQGGGFKWVPPTAQELSKLLPQKTGLAMGTPDYVAPETLMTGVNVDGRADLQAVGVMLYQMLTGNVPRGAFKPASVMIPGIDPRSDAIATKAMKYGREDRHAGAAKLLQSCRCAVPQATSCDARVAFSAGHAHAAHL